MTSTQHRAGSGFVSMSHVCSAFIVSRDCTLVRFQARRGVCSASNRLFNCCELPGFFISNSLTGRPHPWRRRGGSIRIVLSRRPLFFSSWRKIRGRKATPPLPPFVKVTTSGVCLCETTDKASVFPKCERQNRSSFSIVRVDGSRLRQQPDLTSAVKSPPSSLPPPVWMRRSFC